MRHEESIPSAKALHLRARGWVLFLALAALLSACGSGGSSSTAKDPATLREITLVTPGGDSAGGYAPLYIGRELGYFEEEGLKVTVQGSAGSSQAFQLLVAGQGEFALGGVESLMVAIDGGAELTAVYELYSSPSFGLVVPADSGITEISQLRGKTIGITDLAGGEVPVVIGMLADAGIPVSDVTLAPVGGETPNIVEALKSGRIAAFGGSATDFAGLAAVDVEVNKLTTPKTDGFPGGAIAVRRETLTKEPDMVVGFLRAWAKSQHALVTVDGISEAATHAQLPEFWTDEKAGQAQVDSFKHLLIPDPGQRYGEYSRQAWSDYVKYLGLSVPGQDPFIKDPDSFDVKAAVAVELVDKYDDFDQAEVEDEAKKYLAAHS